MITLQEYTERAYRLYEKNMDLDAFKETILPHEETMKAIMGSSYIPLDAFKNGEYEWPDGHQHRFGIHLETEADVNEFEYIMKDVQGKAVLTGYDENGVSLTANARSILGVLYAMSWTKVELVTEEDVFFKIQKFVK